MGAAHLYIPEVVRAALGDPPIRGKVFEVSRQQAEAKSQFRVKLNEKPRPAVEVPASPLPVPVRLPLLGRGPPLVPGRLVRPPARRGWADWWARFRALPTVRRPGVRLELVPLERRLVLTFVLFDAAGYRVVEDQGGGYYRRPRRPGGNHRDGVLPDDGRDRHRVVGLHPGERDPDLRAGETSQSFTVPVIDDTLAEGDALVTVGLAAASGQTVTVYYQTADGTATADNDDTAGEPDEALTLLLSAPSSALLCYPVTATLTLLDAAATAQGQVLDAADWSAPIDSGDGTPRPGSSLRTAGVGSPTPARTPTPRSRPPRSR